MRLVLAAVVCVLLALLAACGDDDDESSADKPKELSGTITVWDVNYKAFPGYTKAAKQLDQEFEAKHPGVTIKHVAQPFAKYDQILQAAFTGRKGPEVMMLVPGAQGVLRWAKGLETLDERVTDAMRNNLGGWNAINEGYDADGTAYGVPVGLQGEVFYYNKKLFKQAGLDPEFEPQSWEEVRDAALKLKEAGITPFTGGNKEGFENQWWFSAGWQTTNTQDDAVALAKGETDFTDETVANALEPEKMMQDADLFDKNRFSTPLFPNGAAAFGEGKGAMFLGLWSTAAYYGDYLDKLGEENIGVFFPPGSNYIGAAPGWAWTIPAFAKDKDAAWEYVKFVTSPEANRTLYSVGGVLPNDKTVEVSPDAPEQERAIIDTVRSSETFPDVHQMIPGKVLTALGTEMNEALQGRKSVEEVQESLQETQEQG